MADICVRRVETATDEQLQQMTAALVAAFDGDEFEKWMVGCNLDLIPMVNEFQIRFGLLGGEVWVAGFGPHDVSAVAVWFGPGREAMDTEEQAEAFKGFLSKLTPEARAWWDEYLPSYLAFANRVLGEGFKKASWHLQLIGTVPSQQRKGLARALVKVIDDRAAETGANLTVETQKAVNVTIYEKLGFTKRGELDVVGPFDLGTAKLYCFEKPA